MRGWWRHRVAACCLRIAVVAAAGAVVVAGMAGSGSASSGPARLSAAQRVVSERAAALVRVRARVTALGAALTALQAQAEALTERYDLAMSLAQQAAAGYQVALTRLAAARQAAAVDGRRLAQQAAADYEADGGLSLATALLPGGTGPQGYFVAAGIQQVIAAKRVDLLAAARADAVVTVLFKRQAAGLLARQRAAAQAAGFLRLAVQAAVRREAGVLKLAAASRGRAAAALASARASEAIRTAQLRAGDGDIDGDDPAAATLAAAAVAPGAIGPAWAPGAGASAAQGEIAAQWALTQLGKPYLWGGAGPDSYDCSGLAMDAWTKAGVRLAHWTGFQWAAGPHPPIGQLRPGDLVFYATNIADPGTIHHVGVYIGNGLMVDAPFTGAFVRIDSIDQWPGLIGATRPAS